MPIDATSTVVAQAFRLLEMTPPSSFADQSEKAVAVAQQYPVVLEALLELCEWSFATKLAELSETPLPEGQARDPDLAFLYQVPGDLLMVRAVDPRGTVWRRDADFLRADQPKMLSIRYTARVSDETRMPASFRTALSHRLAADLSSRFAASRGKARDLVETAALALQQAVQADRNNASPRRWDGRDAPGDWVAEALR